MLPRHLHFRALRWFVYTGRPPELFHNTGFSDHALMQDTFDVPDAVTHDIPGVVSRTGRREPHLRRRGLAEIEPVHRLVDAAVMVVVWIGERNDESQTGCDLTQHLDGFANDPRGRLRRGRGALRGSVQRIPSVSTGMRCRDVGKLHGRR